MAGGRLLANTGSSTWGCDDLGGWDERVGGTLKRKGMYVYLWLIYAVARQK